MGFLRLGGEVKKVYPNTQTPEQALDRWMGLAKSLSFDDVDLLQELLIEICAIVRDFDHITDGLVKQRLLRKRLMYWRGSGVSIDNGPSTRPRPLRRETANDFSVEDVDVYALGRSVWGVFDIENMMLFNIAYEQLLAVLSHQECAYLTARLQGLGWRDIERAGIADRNRQPVIRKRLRHLFFKHFGI